MTILIVDDSKAMRLIVRKALRQAGYENYPIQEACNGKEALDLVRAGAPKLILSDWNMPEMSGIELLTALADQPKIPFGFVTSETTVEMRERAMAAGALFVIAKPFTPEAFGEALGTILPAA